MTRSEYQELVEFLGVRFGTMDRRFDWRPDLNLQDAFCGGKSLLGRMGTFN
jgi:hypothetical protein